MRDLTCASCMNVLKVCTLSFYTIVHLCGSVYVYVALTHYHLLTQFSIRFSFSIDGYNKYVEVVGSSIGAGACANVKRSGKIYKIDDCTKMLHFLSEENDVGGANDWLYTVIEDIVSSRGMHKWGEPKQAVQRSIEVVSPVHCKPFTSLSCNQLSSLGNYYQAFKHRLNLASHCLCMLIQPARNG